MPRRSFGQVKEKKSREGFIIKWTSRGKVSERKGGLTRKAAEAKLAKIRTLVDQGVSHERMMNLVFGDAYGPEVAFRDLRDPYLKFARRTKKKSTYVADCYRLIQICRSAEFAGRQIGEVEHTQIRRWVEQRLSNEVSPSTLNRELALVSAVFRWAMDNGYVEDNPVSRVPRFSEKGCAREVFLTSAEARCYVVAARPDYVLLAMAALSTGMRRGELLSLTWADVDFERDVIRVRSANSKSRRGREIPIGATLRGTLATAAQRRHETSRVFVREDGVPHTETTVRSRHYEARSGLPSSKKGLRFHDLRHTFASILVQSGTPILNVSKIMGHSSVAVTMRYAHLAPGHGRPAIDALDAALALKIAG